MLRFRLLFMLLLALPGLAARAQPQAAIPDSAVSSWRLPLVGAGSAVIYGSSLVLLDRAWYRQQPRASFHFFNDNSQWKQVDKVGHLVTSFHESRFGADVLRWAGAREKNAVWYGGMLGFLLQSPIEILDGYSAAYGASWGDLGANAAGSALVIGQSLAWHELRITPKYSFHTTRYAEMRPNVLGQSIAEQALKDYNGQTYWLAANLKMFLPDESRWPAWLGVAAGYGAQQMVYNDPDSNARIGLKAYRQFYLAPDIDLRAVKTRSKVLKTVLYLVQIVHLPAPALEFSGKHKVRLHPLYF